MDLHNIVKENIGTITAEIFQDNINICRIVQSSYPYPDTIPIGDERDGFVITSLLSVFKTGPKLEAIE